MTFPKTAYKQRILSLAGDGPPMQLLSASRDRVLMVLPKLEKRWDVAYGDGKWTARQVVCHLADIELLVGYRLRQALTQENHQIQPIDENRWALPYSNLDPEMAKQTWLALRNWNLALVASLQSADLQRPAFHPERGPEPVRELLRMLSGHDQNHFAQLQLIAR